MILEALIISLDRVIAADVCQCLQPVDPWDKVDAQRAKSSEGGL